MADRIIAVLEFPFEVDGTILGIEASCGISMAPADGRSADLLLQRADVAMYVAKESQAHVVVYRDELDVNTPDRLALLGRPRGLRWAGASSSSTTSPRRPCAPGGWRGPRP